MSNRITRDANKRVRINRDTNFTNIHAVSVLKIPRYNGFGNNYAIGQIGDYPGMEGDIILNIATGSLCWHDGITWRTAIEFGVWEQQQETVGNPAVVLDNIKLNVTSPFTSPNGGMLNDTENLLFGSARINSTSTTTGADSYNGTRLYFLGSGVGEKQGAFRAGITTSTQWDLENVGRASTAFGTNNIAAAENSAVFGGGFNAVYGARSTICGGLSQRVYGTESGVCSGISHLIYGRGNAILTGEGNQILLPGLGTCMRSAILAGLTNIINTCDLSLIATGTSNVITNSTSSFIGTGNQNMITDGDASVILGGTSNIINNTGNTAILAGNMITNNILNDAAFTKDLVLVATPELAGTHMYSGQTMTPTAVFLNNGGGSATVSILANSTDMAGSISVTPTPEVFPGDNIKLSFGVPYLPTSQPIVTITPTSSAAVNTYFVSDQSSGGFFVEIIASRTEAINFNYHVTSIDAPSSF